MQTQLIQNSVYILNLVYFQVKKSNNLKLLNSMLTLGYAEMVYRVQILKLFQKKLKGLSLEHRQILLE